MTYFIILIAFIHAINVYAFARSICDSHKSPRVLYHPPSYADPVKISAYDIYVKMTHKSHRMLDLYVSIRPILQLNVN